MTLHFTTQMANMTTNNTHNINTKTTLDNTSGLWWKLRLGVTRRHRVNSRTKTLLRVTPNMTLQPFDFMPWWGACCHGREFCGSWYCLWVLWFGIAILVLGSSRRGVARAARVSSWHPNVLPCDHLIVCCACGLCVLWSCVCGCVFVCVFVVVFVVVCLSFSL